MKTFTDRDLLVEARESFPNAVSKIEAVDSLAQEYYRSAQYFADSMMSKEYDEAVNKYRQLRDLYKRLWNRAANGSDFIILDNQRKEAINV